MQFNQRMARMARLSPIFTEGVGIGASGAGASGSTGTPTGLAVTGGGTGTLAVTWNAVVGATSYDVRRSGDNSSWTTLVNQSSGMTDTTALATTYFQVRANSLAGASPWSSSVSAQIFVLYDLFNGSDGTNLTAHAMDVGPGWTSVIPSITIQSHAAQAQGNPTIDVSESSQANATITINGVVAATSTGVQEVARETDANNFWLLSLSSGAFRILEVASGVFTTRATTPWTFDRLSHRLQFVLSGTTASATLDGGSAISYGSAASNQTATKHGLRGFAIGVNKDVWTKFIVTSP